MRHWKGPLHSIVAWDQNEKCGGCASLGLPMEAAYPT